MSGIVDRLEAAISDEMYRQAKEDGCEWRVEQGPALDFRQIAERAAEAISNGRSRTMKCELCGYPIKRGHLFVRVMRAADDQGNEMQWDGPLAVHAGPCPTVSIDEPCLD